MAKSGARLNWGGMDKAMAGAAKALDDRGRKALLADVGEALVSSTIQRFQEGKDPEGKPWEPSKRATATSGKTLLDKGQLQGSITAATTASAVYVGSNLAYARIHQKGGKAGRGHKTTIKKRAYLGISEDDKEEIAAIMADHLKNGFLGR